MIIDCISDEQEKIYIEQQERAHSQEGCYIHKVFRCVTGELGYSVRHLSRIKEHLCTKENYTCHRIEGDRQLILDSKSNMPIFVNFCPFCGEEA